jgi:dolichol-phosphate mannosyltransferase
MPEERQLPAEPDQPAEPHHRHGIAQRALRVLASPSKFAIVGILGIVVNQVALVLFTEVLGIYYIVSSILASQVSTLSNFLLTEFWVFRAREARGQALVRYLIFNAVNVATLLIRIPVLYFLTDHFGVHYTISNLVAIGLTFGIRYLIADNWIWAGRDQRAQKPVRGAFQYDIHSLVRIRSAVALPELAAFNVAHEVEQPDLVVRRRWLGGWPRLRISTWRDGRVIRYREQLGALSAAFDIGMQPPESREPVTLEANWLLLWSHHVLYTNMVEPLLRFQLVSRGYVLLHCAAIDGDAGALVMSAKTDTGKTSTVLRLLVNHDYGFLSDDMAILGPGGQILGYPKPMTLSSHTMNAVSDKALPWADRMMLAVRSKLHSREGRAVGHALGRLPIPIVTLNAWVQLFIPPPKYHVTSLVDCDVVDHSRVRAVVLMERGEPLVEEPSREHTIDELLQNTEDAYTFPPFATFAPLLMIGGLSNHELLARERELLREAIAPASRVRIRVRGHNWSELLPGILDGTMPTMASVSSLPESDTHPATNGSEPGIAAISREEIDPRTVGSSAHRATRDGGG